MKGHWRTWRARFSKGANFFRFSRTGAFESLWLHGVAVAGSKTAVASVNAVYFASGLLEDSSADEYSVADPGAADRCARGVV